jgi:hypothetical protein
MPLPRRAQFAIAQLGSKRGADQSLARLLSADEIPGENWKKMDERSWRAGSIGPVTPWGQRSRAAKNVVGWRSFEKENGEKWIWIQVVPYVSNEDARSALGGATLGDGIANLRAEVRLVAQKFIEDAECEGLDAVRVLIQDTSGPRGENTARMIYGVVGSFLIVMAITSYSDSWTDSEVSSTVNLQARRIRSIEGD